MDLVVINTEMFHNQLIHVGVPYLEIFQLFVGCLH